MKLKALLEGLVSVSVPDGEMDIVHLTSDSREVRSGALFVCVKGFRTDGHQYVAEAVKRGAVVILAQDPVTARVPVMIVPDTAALLSPLAAKFYGHPTDDLRVIGVTGTNGKTTTTYLLEAIFKLAGHRPGVIGTIQYRVGGQTIPASHTTPDAMALQRTLADMKRMGASHIVMEVSSHALSLGRVDDCEFDGAVFTNLTQDHLDFHLTMEAYGEAKRRLFTSLTSRSRKPVIGKYAVINADDEFSGTLMKGLSVPVWTYGIRREAMVRATEVVSTREGLSGRVKTPVGEVELRMILRGRHNVENGLAALACALAEKVPMETALAALAECGGAPGRLEWIKEGQPFMVVVDYAHTPDALRKTLQAVREFQPKRVITVFGCGGDRDRAKRPLMGAIAAEMSHYAVLTSDNPRSEDPEAILTEIEAGAKKMTGRTWVKEVNRERAIQHALEQAQPDDLVLIAGKGHETYQIIGQQIVPFDDREVARRHLKQRFLVKGR